MALRSKAASKTEYNSRPFTKSNLAGRSFCLGVMPIPCPHFKITIVKRSQGQSAVAGAAYQSGERLFSEYDQRTKFYNKKKELVHAEIMLPSYAPPGYADRATLWNAVEAVENQWNSQLARRIVLAFPVEVPKEQYLSMIKEFCQEQFVSKGMIADFAIHDKGDGNPHAHILLTLRAIDEHGKWLPKARKPLRLYRRKLSPNQRNKSCLKIMQNRMALLTASTLPTMGGLGLILTVRIGSA